MEIRRLRGWLARLFSLFNRKQREREFAEELESHLAFHTEFRIILDSMEPQNVQIAPEIIQAITREAAARGL